MTLPPGSTIIFDRSGLDRLMAELRREGFDLIGPTVADGALILDHVTQSDDLPAGWTDTAEPGAVRLHHTGGPQLFGCTLAAQGWKRFLYPPHQRLFAAERAGDGFRILRPEPPTAPLAFLGVRACEMAAITVQDRVFGGQGFDEPGYLARRRAAFIVAVDCGRSGATCFCASSGHGPAVGTGFDIRLVELVRDDAVLYVAEAGTPEGMAILAHVPSSPATEDDLAAAADQPRQAAAQQTRRLPADTPTILANNLQSPRWAEVAQRCLTCGNCTMVCPTCFCTTVEDRTNLSGNQAERWRSWDSCFTIDYAFIHGGSLRQEASSRYRQWINHKLSTWHEQFGTSGCTGCGRCIAWCPVGIDITEEVAALEAQGKD